MTIRQSLRDLAPLWADLGDTRRSPALDGGGSGIGHPEACPDCDAGLPCTRQHRAGHEPLSPTRVEARWRIREIAARWCRILDREFGVQLPGKPPTTVRWQAHHVAVNVGLILASTQHAWSLWADLHGFYDDGGTWWPGVMNAVRLLDSGHRHHGVRVKCPACKTWVRLHDDDREIRCWGTLSDGLPCQEWGTLDYWRTLIVPDSDQPMTATELVDWLWQRHQYRATPEIIWQWASRGTRYGRLTRVETPLTGEHTLSGTARYDPVRAAEIVLQMRANRR